MIRTFKVKQWRLANDGCDTVHNTRFHRVTAVMSHEEKKGTSEVQRLTSQL